ncbi:MAG TPA: phosphoribosyltransferase family protein [Pyrinomonadaceae bacterium]|nr:phosphoribosyltransferase family protein [Pyrinomonadaceae bacterium]
MNGRVVELHGAQAIEARVGALANDISARFGDRELTVLGVLEDGFVFLSDLLRALRVPSLRTSFVRHEHRSLGGMEDLTFSTPVDISGREVLLVEAVLDTGVTQEYLLKHLAERGASGVHLCVLLDKSDRRRTQVRADWAAFQSNEDYVFGYGLGLQERWRELPFLATFERPER